MPSAAPASTRCPPSRCTLPWLDWWLRSRPTNCSRCEAAVHGDREAAYQALLAHPLGPAEGQIDAVLDEMLAINRPYLPQFFHDRPAA